MRHWQRSKPNGTPCSLKRRPWSLHKRRGRNYSSRLVLLEQRVANRLITHIPGVQSSSVLDTIKDFFVIMSRRKTSAKADETDDKRVKSPFFSPGEGWQPGNRQYGQTVRMLATHSPNPSILPCSVNLCVCACVCVCVRVRVRLCVLSRLTELRERTRQVTEELHQLDQADAQGSPSLLFLS